jgi:protocatechuate 3,4-dioxygenase beta subunit
MPAITLAELEIGRQCRSSSRNGRFRTDANGKMNFASVVPGDYPVLTFGVTGSLLQKLGRHGYRACHIHYRIEAAGHEPLMTMMYFNHSLYVDSDTIF